MSSTEIPPASIDSWVHKPQESCLQSGVLYRHWVPISGIFDVWFIYTADLFSSRLACHLHGDLHRSDGRDNYLFLQCLLGVLARPPSLAPWKSGVAGKRSTATPHSAFGPDTPKHRENTCWEALYWKSTQWDVSSARSIFKTRKTDDASWSGGGDEPAWEWTFIEFRFLFFRMIDAFIHRGMSNVHNAYVTGLINVTMRSRSSPPRVFPEW